MIDKNQESIRVDNIRLDNIRLLIVDADPGSKADHQGLVDISQGVEIIGIAHSKRSAIQMV